MATNEIENLYTLPLDEFTAARNELVKALRARGETDDAKHVAKLKKPTAPAWAINKAARANPNLIERLLGAGDKLRDVQRKVLRGGDPADLRDASNEERALVAELTVEAARALGDTATAAYRERIADTLSAIAVDPDLHDTLKAGTLGEEHRRVGFGEVPDLKLVPQPKTKDGNEDRKRAQEVARRKEAEARATALNTEADELEREAADLQRKVELTKRKAATLREQADAALRANPRR